LKKLVFISLSLLLLLFVIPGCFTFPVQTTNPTPQVVTPPVVTPPVIEAFSSNPSTISVSPPPSTPALFSVTGIRANTEPSNFTGCSNLYANITANGAGTATYIWESTDSGGYSYTWNIVFPTAGTQKISLPVEMRGLPSGPYQVHVLTPNDIVSNSTYYTTCAP
jgi:hypothetical protein